MNVIVKPVVTEKTVEEMKKGKYTFLVSKTSDKSMIKESVQNNFKVDVLETATINMKQRKKRTMQGKTVRIHAFKKAVVKIKEGQKIDVFNVGGGK